MVYYLQPWSLYPRSCAGFGDIAFNQLERCQASRTAVAAVAGVAAVAMVCGLGLPRQLLTSLESKNATPVDCQRSSVGLFM